MTYIQCQYMKQYNKDTHIAKDKCMRLAFEHLVISELGAPLSIFICDEHLFFVKVKHD